ncbi:MAG: hypothetical protein EHM21_11490, partial [Chloroflexi bacterium]
TFIGRENEQAEVEQLIGTHRLVTLIGSGGVGKTRLALKVGGQLLEKYASGVWFVELAPLGDPERLEQTVASVFGIVAQSSSIPYTQLLVNFLRAKTALLILDNCEHLVDACAQFTDTLLKNCPQLKILATSRQALGILGEIQYRLPSLGLPGVQQTFEEIRNYESVRLFAERAQLAQPDFKLTAENAASVAQICARLDVIPLAIGLAAARVNIFSTEQLAARLMDCFDLLTGGSRTALPRQQTIRTSIDWSWKLISDAERTLLQRLTIFAGGWTLEAAEAVCADRGNARLSAASAAEAVCADHGEAGLPAASAAESVYRTADIAADQVLELMTQLVAKSLVNANRQREQERRFDMHATINQYAHEKLVEAGEQETIRDQHLSYYLDLSRQAETAMHGPQQMAWFDRWTDERDNLRVALEHAAGTNLEAGLYLSGRLLDFWRYYDLREGLRWTTMFVQNPESKTYPHARAKALLAQGNLVWNMQQFEVARSIAEECLAVFRASGDREGEYETLLLMGGVAQFLEGMDQKTVFQLEALNLARSMGDVWREGRALSTLGWDRRDLQLSRQRWEEAIVLLRQAGDWRGLAETLGILGFTVLSDGDLEAAQKFLEEAYAVNQKINYKEMEFVLTGKGILALLRGEYRQARDFLQMNTAHLEEMGNRMGVLWSRARIAYVALREGNVEE